MVIDYLYNYELILLFLGQKAVTWRACRSDAAYAICKTAKGKGCLKFMRETVLNDESPDLAGSGCK